MLYNKFGYLALFDAYIIGSDPLFGSIIPFFWLYRQLMAT